MASAARFEERSVRKLQQPEIFATLADSRCVVAQRGFSRNTKANCENRSSAPRCRKLSRRAKKRRFSETGGAPWALACVRVSGAVFTRRQFLVAACRLVGQAMVVGSLPFADRRQRPPAKIAIS